MVAPDNGQEAISVAAHPTADSRSCERVCRHEHVRIRQRREVAVLAIATHG